MKRIPVSMGRAFALVDDEDEALIISMKWHLDSKGYACNNGKRNFYKRKRIYMHRLINNTPSDAETDHINGNRLDNQRKNLRTVTHKENCRNNHSTLSNSGHLGVNWHKASKKWRAYIQVDGKHIYLGTHHNLEDAVALRKVAEDMYWKSTTLS